MNDLGVIFDMDGVLVNSYQAHLKSWQRTAARHDLSMTVEQFAGCFGRTTREIIRQFWASNFDEAGVTAFDVEKEAAYREILLDHFPEMDGAGDLIGALHAAGFRLAIGSSGPPANVAVVRSQIHNGGLFSATVNGMDVKHGKPEPDIFLAAAEKLGLEPRRCAVVEDAPVGLEAAHRAGMAAIGLLGTAPREQLAAKADLVVDSLRKLTPAIVADLIRRR
jgi:beta-phosphoglucomutase